MAVAAITGAALVTSVSASSNSMGSSSSEHVRSGVEFHWNFSVYFIVGAILSTINTVLSVVLLVTYVGIYKRTRAQFNLVLMIVAFMLLCYSLVANPLLHTVLGYGGSGLGPFFMLPNLFTFAALCALLHLTLKY